MPERERECRRCGALVRVAPAGHLRAHRCEHGAHCILSVRRRIAGERVTRCPKCLEGRQLVLPFPEPHVRA